MLPPPYRRTRRSTSEILRGNLHEGLIDGSDPSGGGPTVRPLAGSDGATCSLKLNVISRSNSISSPFTLPENVLFPALNDTFPKSTLPSVIGIGTSFPPKKPPPVPSTVPVRLLPSCRSVNTIVAPPEKNASSSEASSFAGASLHSPVIPVPAGTSRSQTATWGRNPASFAIIVTVEVTSPGQLASTVTVPELFAAWTTPMHRPETAVRDVPLSDS